MLAKLKNDQGATLLMALLFLLVAILVSSVVLVAASGAAKVADQVRSAQQTYLTVSSAAELLARQLKTAQVYIDTYTIRQGEDVITTVQDPVGTGSSLLQAHLAAGIRLLDAGSSSYSPDAFLVVCPGEAGAYLEPVEGKLTMTRDDTGSVWVVLTLESQGMPCQLVIRAGSRQTVTETENGVRLTYTWDPLIQGQEVAP